MNASASRVPANRYACVAASASLVAQYFGRAATDVDVFQRLKVAEDGSASLGVLVEYFTECGMHWRAYDRCGLWELKEYVTERRCCVVMVTARADTHVRHSMTLFPGRAGTIVMGDILNPPSVVSDEYLVQALKGASLIVVSEQAISPPLILHLKRFGIAYLALGGLAALAGWLILRRDPARARRHVQ
jgi:hypothetical protein